MDWLKPIADIYEKWGWIGVFAGLVIIASILVLQWFLSGLKKKLDTLESDFKKHLEFEAEENIRMERMHTKINGIDEQVETHVFGQLKDLWKANADNMRLASDNFKELSNKIDSSFKTLLDAYLDTRGK